MRRWSLMVVKRSQCTIHKWRRRNDDDCCTITACVGRSACVLCANELAGILHCSIMCSNSSGRLLQLHSCNTTAFSCFRNFLPVAFLQLRNFLFASLFVSNLVLLQVCPHALQHCTDFLQLFCFTLFLDLFSDLLHEVLLFFSVLGLQLFPMFSERLPILGVAVTLCWSLFQAWCLVYSSKHLSVCLR
uniref:Uncharacterized protein n=1 Tax=Rhipicephalus microplus TaxID=6941 RepID=A0A6G5AEY1_RHIMP